MVLAGACCDGGPVERTSFSLPVPTTIARLVTSLVPQLVGVASLVVSSRRLGLPPLLFCSVGLPQGDARDRDLDEFPGNISANKKMQMHPASRLHPRGSSHSFSAGGSEERVFHGTRRHVRVPIRPQRPPAAAGKASLPPPAHRPAHRPASPERSRKQTTSLFSLSLSPTTTLGPTVRRASVTDPQLLLQHLVTHSSSTTSRLRAGTVGNRDTTTATASPTINTNSSLTAEMP